MQQYAMEYYIYYKSHLINRYFMSLFPESTEIFTMTHWNWSCNDVLTNIISVSV